MRNTEGNVELIEAAVDRINELFNEAGNDIINLLDKLDSPLDERSITMLRPHPIMDIAPVLVAAYSEDYEEVDARIMAMCVKAFMLGYVCSKMEAGTL